METFTVKRRGKKKAAVDKEVVEGGSGAKNRTRLAVKKLEDFWERETVSGKGQKEVVLREEAEETGDSGKGRKDSDLREEVEEMGKNVRKGEERKEGSQGSNVNMKKETCKATKDLQRKPDGKEKDKNSEEIGVTETPTTRRSQKEGEGSEEEGEEDRAGEKASGNDDKNEEVVEEEDNRDRSPSCVQRASGNKAEGGQQRLEPGRSSTQESLDLERVGEENRRGEAGDNNDSEGESTLEEEDELGFINCERLEKWMADWEKRQKEEWEARIEDMEYLIRTEVRKGMENGKCGECERRREEEERTKHWEDDQLREVQERLREVEEEAEVLAKRVKE
ncbi:cilia- and flagella-associated protein 251-like [Diachasma alloeum]|uniref:cilia- and flagella-associated protein 251-like n=1 Tax=Diachasma alloeum TaxID=454923 RepID=UPI0010FADCBA|nr:cilia- and flagella-associated protein 251-like [Diachasma alloeum]